MSQVDSNEVFTLAKCLLPLSITRSLSKVKVPEGRSIVWMLYMVLAPGGGAIHCLVLAVISLFYDVCFLHCPTQPLQFLQKEIACKLQDEKNQRCNQYFVNFQWATSSCGSSSGGIVKFSFCILAIRQSLCPDGNKTKSAVFIPSTDLWMTIQLP